ncbi:glycosyltransferase family 4 protein (plasmid) [Haladaptatus sp. SPP-AMP-3]|uniref:glycosyltransferase family 4 protein n=1 Tax=Haladaptatus sp. SPP-AMP-3 TaxID=3121295 RepID=UPI003C30DA22
MKEISERLVERGHEVTVVTADAGSDVTNREKRRGVSVHRCRGFAPENAFHIAPGIIRAVRRAKPDVVHAHNYHSVPMLCAALATDAPLVVTPHYHGESSSRIRNHLLRAYRPLGRWALNEADAIIAVSEWESRRLEHDFGTTADVIPNGLRIERFTTAEPVDHSRPYLLCVGRLEEYKGVQHAIRTLTTLPEYDLLVAGSGSYRSALRRLARQTGVEEQVKFLGYVAGDRLPGLYAGATAYLLLSEFEAYGMTVAEALASGTPCVVRTGSALDDWLENPGVVPVTDLSPDSITNAISEARTSKTGTDRIISWNQVAERIERSYSSVLTENRSGACRSERDNEGIV